MPVRLARWARIGDWLGPTEISEGISDGCFDAGVEGAKFHAVGSGGWGARCSGLLRVLVVGTP